MEKNLEKHVLKGHGNNHNVINQGIKNDDKLHQHQHHQTPNQLPFPGCYNVNLRFDPIIPEVGKPTELILSVTDQKLGDPITKFEVLHDKLMHVIIVAEDLSYFAHIHPEIKDIDDNTRFTVSHTFPESSKYKLWVDFKPKDGNQTLAAFKFNVTGHSPHISEELVYDGKYTKESSDGQYLIRLKMPDKIVAQNDVDFAFSMSDSSGRPITNLQPLMAAGGHCVIISSDLKEFLHVHTVV